MQTLRQLFSLRKTPQNRPIPHKNQVRNNAGGYAFPLDDWARFDRFLILGSEGGTYYATGRVLTVENANAVLRCIVADGQRVIDRVVEISVAGRAPKNDPALFVLALAAAAEDVATRRAALNALPQVARIGTHLFTFMHFVEGMRGWGRALRRAVGNWYNEMPAGKLAYQAVKYQQRNGWSHRDVLRLSHPQASSDQHGTIYHWMTQGWKSVGNDPHPDEALQLIWAFERAKRAENVSEIKELIRDFGLPWEAVPAQWLGDKTVWEMLLARLPLTALIRNLARLTTNGLLVPNGEHVATVVARLENGDALRKARVHPIQLLSALTTYSKGQGVRGKLKWTPVTAIVDALDEAFYLAFQHVKPTGKRLLIGLDVSASMSWGEIARVPGLTPRTASAAMSLVTAATEKRVAFVAFTGKLMPLNISRRQRIDDVVKLVSELNFGATDCALPMIYALKHNLPVDTFIIYTDNETWYGDIHPTQALQEYRQKMGIPAKLIVVGMTANSFSIANPDDGGMLDVVGFDTAAPALMSDFIRA